MLDPAQLVVQRPSDVAQDHEELAERHQQHLAQPGESGLQLLLCQHTADWEEDEALARADLDVLVLARVGVNMQVEVGGHLCPEGGVVDELPRAPPLQRVLAVAAERLLGELGDPDLRGRCPGSPAALPPVAIGGALAGLPVRGGGPRTMTARWTAPCSGAAPPCSTGGSSGPTSRGAPRGCRPSEPPVD